MIDVFERWSMPPDEADELRRRVMARQRLMQIDSDSPAD
jgi:hypothetical protein